MTAFINSPEAVFRGTFCLLALAGLLSVVCFAMSVSYRLKPKYIVPEVFVLAGSVLFFGMLYGGIIIRDIDEKAEGFLHAAYLMPAWAVVLITFALLAVAGICFAFVVRKRLSSLTAMSVKEALSALPAGICFYDESGRVLLMNKQIDGECRTITGKPLYDGAMFWKNMCEGKTLDGILCTCRKNSVIAEKKGGAVKCYKRIVHEINGKTVFELSGNDISREYMLKRELEEGNEKLRKMNERLRRYGENVTQLTKERETLAARVKIHDSMGALLLTTKKALSQGTCDKEQLISAWNNILSFIYVPEFGAENKFAEAKKTADSVGVKICYSGARPPKNSTAEKILAAAVFECVTNTARHADGDRLDIAVEEDAGYYTARFTNNGNLPPETIKEGGGLSSLRTFVENSGGSMAVQSRPHYMLTLKIPKGEDK